MTALHMSVKLRYPIPVFKWLYSLNPKLVNAIDVENRTVLHLAIELNRMDYVKVLLTRSNDESDIDINIGNKVSCV